MMREEEEEEEEEQTMHTTTTNTVHELRVIVRDARGDARRNAAESAREI